MPESVISREPIRTAPTRPSRVDIWNHPKVRIAMSGSWLDAEPA